MRTCRYTVRRLIGETDVLMDTVAPNIRSRMMSAVKGKNTKPELLVRRALYSAGFRYRIHGRGLPGHPDIVLPRLKVAVFVHGCFWHGHNCKKGKRPKSNTEFWNKKLRGNLVRDRQNQKLLKAIGWRVFVVWECSLEVRIKKLIRAIRRIKANENSAV